MKNLKIQDPELRMVLDAPCKFEDYDVVYDDEAMVKKYQKLAQKYGVTTSTKSYADVAKPYANETCEGTVENCIRYLRTYIESDHGYIAGQCFSITDKTLLNDPQFKVAFVKFIDWISASKRFDDFKVGCLGGSEATKKLLA